MFITGFQHLGQCRLRCCLLVEISKEIERSGYEKKLNNYYSHDTEDFTILSTALFASIVTVVSIDYMSLPICLCRSNLNYHGAKVINQHIKRLYLDQCYFS